MKRLSVAFGATAAVVACSSSDTRERFEENDAGGSASLPEASELDGSTPVDATEKPPFDSKDEPVTCTTMPCAVRIVAGENHFCTRMSDGTVRCWGDNSRGSLGVDDAGVAEDLPDAGDPGDGGWRATRVMDFTGATQLSAGGTTTCAVVGDGGVYCWGGNDKGQLGLDVTAPVFDDGRHPTPTPVALAGGVTRVDVGQASACAVLASGEVWCSGDNSRKQLARTTATSVGAPAKAELGGLPIARTAAGTYTSLAVTTSGDVVSWGAVAGAEGSVSARVASQSPDALPLSIELGSVTSLSVSSTTIHDAGRSLSARGIGHACAIVNGEVFCWGDSLMGALGVGVPGRVQKPFHAGVTSKTAWPQQVVAAGDITCVRLTDGTVECTGDNAFGALGRDPKTPFSGVFKPAETFKEHAVQIAAASRTVCAVVQGGNVVCWGSNERSELGQGRNDNDPHSAPISVRF